MVEVCWGAALPAAPGASAELCPDQMMMNVLLHPGVHLGALEVVSGLSSLGGKVLFLN